MSESQLAERDAFYNNRYICLVGNLTIHEREKIIQENKDRRWSLIISGADKVRFDAGDVYKYLGLGGETDWYSDLFSDFIYFDNIGEQVENDVYYIEPSIYNTLIEVFADFNIPPEENKVLIHYYLSMFLGGNECEAVDLFTSTQKKELARFRDFYDLLNSISDEEHTITSITICSKPNDSSKASEFESQRKVSDSNSISLIEALVKNGFSDIDFIKSYKHVYDFQVSSLREGKKNSLSAKIDEYSLSMFKYLKSIKLEKPISERKLYLLIGKVVIEAELLDKSKGEDDELLIDLIKKRIQKLLKSKE